MRSPVVSPAVTVVAYIMSIASLSPAVRYTASFLYIDGSFWANPLVITWAVSTLGRTPENRAAGAAVVNVMERKPRHAFLLYAVTWAALSHGLELRDGWVRDGFEVVVVEEQCEVEGTG